MWKILKTLSDSPVFALSNHTTFSQTQTGATVPLRPLLLKVTGKFKQELEISKLL
jgi:hypothetical protein